MVSGLASTASAAVQAQQLADQNIAVAKTAQDHQKIEGEAAVSLIDTAASVQKGGPTGDHTGQYVNVRA